MIQGAFTSDDAVDTEGTAAETHYTYFPGGSVGDGAGGTASGSTAAVVTTQGSEALLGQATPPGTGETLKEGGGFASDPVQPQDLEPSCLPHPLYPPQPILFILSSLPILLPSTSSSPYSSCSPSSDFPILPPCLSIFLVLSVLSTLPPILPERGQAEGHQPSLSPDSLSPDLQASSS